MNMCQHLRERMGRKKGEREERGKDSWERRERAGEIIQGSEHSIELGRRKVRMRDAEAHVLQPSLSF